MPRSDFSEVAHTGGIVTFTIDCDSEGNVGYQIGYSHSSPTPVSLVGIYAHRDGFPCGNIQMGGIGDPWNPPPLPNCVAVLMASDSQGRYGHECAECHKHFRTPNIPAKFLLTCPYCGLRVESFHFLTPPQKAYVAEYLERLSKGIEEVQPGSTLEVVIDMNAVADAVEGEPRQDFYYGSIEQQTEFKCSKCNTYNDVRGKFAYCASCGWRNNLTSFERQINSIRARLNSNSIAAEDAVKQAVSEFDSTARNYVAQLAKIPMRPARRRRLENTLFHNLDSFHNSLLSAFDIDLLHGMKADIGFLTMMFARRHVYEHDGGVATSRYVERSGDSMTAEGELIRETQDNAHRLMGTLCRMMKNFDSGFHEIFEPEPFCIELEVERKARMGQR